VDGELQPEVLCPDCLPDWPENHALAGLIDLADRMSRGKSHHDTAKETLEAMAGYVQAAQDALGAKPQEPGAEEEADD